MNRFVDDNNNKRDEDYLSIFNCFLSTAETFVFICVKLTFISRLRKYLIGYRWSFNTRDTIMSVERQTFCKGRKCGVLPDNSYIRLFKVVLTETNHEWHEARIIISSFDWWSVWTIHIQMTDGSANGIFKLFIVKYIEKRFLSIKNMHYSNGFFSY